jgi:hypothetical protein
MVTERFREMNHSRWFDQIVGSVITALIVGLGTAFYAFASDFVSLPKDVKQLKVELREAVVSIKEDVERRTVERRSSDKALDQRVTVLEQHKQVK